MEDARRPRFSGARGASRQRDVVHRLEAPAIRIDAGAVHGASDHHGVAAAGDDQRVAWLHRQVRALPGARSHHVDADALAHTVGSGPQQVRQSPVGRRLQSPDLHDHVSDGIALDVLDLRGDRPGR